MLMKHDDRVKALIDVSKDLEGLPRHSSTHAAGVVIASKPLVEYVPFKKMMNNSNSIWYGNIRRTWTIKDGFPWA